jgi:hypothetical protein
LSLDFGRAPDVLTFCCIIISSFNVTAITVIIWWITHFWVKNANVLYDVQYLMIVHGINCIIYHRDVQLHMNQCRNFMWNKCRWYNYSCWHMQWHTHWKWFELCK